MLKYLIIIIPCTLAIFINLLCILGKIDFSIMYWSFKAVTLFLLIGSLIFSLYHSKQRKLQDSETYHEEKSTPRKTLLQLTFFCTLIGHMLTALIAFILHA